VPFERRTDEFGTICVPLQVSAVNGIRRQRSAVHRPIRPRITLQAQSIQHSSLDWRANTSEQLASRILDRAAGIQLIEYPLGEGTEHHIGRMVDRVGGVAPGTSEQIGGDDIGVPAFASPQLAEARLGCLSQTVVRDRSIPVLVAAEAATGGENRP
jgi:hypothetical protein